MVSINKKTFNYMFNILKFVMKIKVEIFFLNILEMSCFDCGFGGQICCKFYDGDEACRYEKDCPTYKGMQSYELFQPHL